MIVNPTPSVRGAAEQASYDEGLRVHMLHIYNYLAAGLGLSALSGWIVFSLATTTNPGLAVTKLPNGVLLTALGKTLYFPPWAIVLCLAPIAIMIIMAIGHAFLGLIAAKVGYWTFVATMGASASVVLVLYSLPVILQFLAITAASFAILSLYGYMTKRDLSGWGTFLYMGLAGVILASIINIYLRSDALTFAQTVASVLIFAGFTAYDTQQQKDRYLQVAGNKEALASAAVWGAMDLFLDFVGLFLNLLKLFGEKK